MVHKAAQLKVFYRKVASERIKQVSALSNFLAHHLGFSLN